MGLRSLVYEIPVESGGNLVFDFKQLVVELAEGRLVLTTPAGALGASGRVCSVL